jgi:YfiH family protein
MFERVFSEGNLLGHLYRLPDGFAFFGSEHLSKEDLPRFFPSLNFYFLKQVHGNKVLPVNASLQEADGHWTTRPNEAPVIQTADCIPVMIHTPTHLFALHAGWRGVEQNILREALKTLSSKDQVTVLLGPHITKESFEVGADVAARLLNADPKKDLSALLPHSERKKRFVDLEKIVFHQIQEFLPEFESAVLDINTYTSADHPSYRKTGPGAGRLFSFIVRTEHFPNFPSSETIKA